jgi:hypothetical protein
MRYFHRTPLPPDEVVRQAETFFAGRAQPLEAVGRRRAFRHPAGIVSIEVRVEGGHYTHVSVTTDQVGESEVDKLAKRFLATVHAHADPGHEVRGAY